MLSSSLLALALAFGPVSTTAAPPQDAASVTLAAAQPWPVGTRWRIEMEKLNEETDDSGRRSTRGSTTSFDVEVVASSADGMTQRWTCGATKPLKTLKEADALTQRVLGVTQGLVFDVRASASGAPLGFVDESAARASFDKLVEDVRRAVREQAKEPGDLLAALDASVDGFAGDAFEKTLLREPAQAFAANGRALTPKAPLESQATLPNPIDGAALPCTERWSLAALDTAAGTARVEWQQSVDPTVATKLTREALRKKLAEQDKKRPFDEYDDDRLPWISRLDERAKIEFDLRRGMAKSAEFVRTSEISGKTHVKTKRLRVTALEPAK